MANWREQPPVAYSSPPAPNTFQDPTKWNGDHTLNGGNKEWSEEDAALHAYTMEYVSPAQKSVGVVPRTSTETGDLTVLVRDARRPAPDTHLAA